MRWRIADCGRLRAANREVGDAYSANRTTIRPPIANLQSEICSPSQLSWQFAVESTQ